MTADIRYVGLDGAMCDKLKQAIPIVRMRRLEASFDALDGRGCDLLVADPHSQDGKSTIEWAIEHAIPVVIIGRSDAAEGAVFGLTSDASIAGVTRVLNRALASVGSYEDPTALTHEAG